MTIAISIIIARSVSNYVAIVISVTSAISITIGTMLNIDTVISKL